MAVAPLDGIVRCRECEYWEGIEGTEKAGICKHEGMNHALTAYRFYCGYGDLKNGAFTMNFYDEEEVLPDCTVQILRNTVTGDESVGWWVNSPDDGEGEWDRLR